MKNQKLKIFNLSDNEHINQTKAIIFDSSSLISLAMNGLLEELKKLKEIFKGDFIITKEVKNEIIDAPLKTKKYELEAMKLQSLVDGGFLTMSKILGVDEKQITKMSMKFMVLANEMFLGNGQKINLIQIGEASCLALSKLFDEKKINHVLCIDERTTRLLVEKPENLKEFLDALLYALKFKGCAISNEEIEEIKKFDKGG